MRVVLPVLSLALCAWAQQVSQYPSLVDKAREALTTGNVTAVQVDPRGDVYFLATGLLGTSFDVREIGTGLHNGYDDIAVIKMDATMERVLFATLIGGSQTDRAQGMKVDSDGNVFITGLTGSPDFPFTRGGLPPTAQFATGFVLKLNASGGFIEYAASLGERVWGWAIDVDAMGNLYIGGQAWAGSLPVTPGAYQGSAPRVGNQSAVLKLSPGAGRVEFATYVTEAVNPSAVSQTYGTLARPDGTVVFLTESSMGVLDPAGTRVEFSAPTGGRSRFLGTDAAGNIYVGGHRDSSLGYRVDKFSASGTKLYERELEASGELGGMVVFPDGKVLLTGDAPPPYYPTRNAIEPCFANIAAPAGPAGIAVQPSTEKALAVLNPDGSVLLSTFFRMRLGPMGLSRDGAFLYAPGIEPTKVTGIQGTQSYNTQFWGGWVRLDLSRISTSNRVAPACLAHGATYLWSAAAPGEIMTIYGSNLGPETGTSFTLRDSLVPPDLAGTRVTVDGKPAPVLYAQNAQINFIVPWSAKPSGTTEICVERGDEQGCLSATGDTIAPAPFWLGTGSVLNLDGTVNTEQNRVARGGYVTLFLTGTGLQEGPLVDGAVSGSILQRISATLTATVQGDLNPPCMRFFGGPCPPRPELPVEVTYAGSAPTLVSGVTQINLRIPEAIPPGSRSLTLNFTPSGLSLPVRTIVHIAP